MLQNQRMEWETTLEGCVAQSIPVFAMSVFKLPKGVCKDITDVIAKFWWGDDENTKRMHRWAWWKLCFPKKDGGMGFHDLHSFNLAILAKQVWRLIDEPESLCARVLRAKYYPSGDILKAGPKKRSICDAWLLIRFLSSVVAHVLLLVTFINWCDNEAPFCDAWTLVLQHGSILDYAARVWVPLIRGLLQYTAMIRGLIMHCLLWPEIKITWNSILSCVCKFLPPLEFGWFSLPWPWVARLLFVIPTSKHHLSKLFLFAL